MSEVVTIKYNPKKKDHVIDFDLSCKNLIGKKATLLNIEVAKCILLPRKTLFEIKVKDHTRGVEISAGLHNTDQLFLTLSSSLKITVQRFERSERKCEITSDTPIRLLSNDCIDGWSLLGFSRDSGNRITQKLSIQGDNQWWLTYGLVSVNEIGNIKEDIMFDVFERDFDENPLWKNNFNHTFRTILDHENITIDNKYSVCLINSDKKELSLVLGGTSVVSFYPIHLDMSVIMNISY
jgi:hypothetical protein